MGWVQAILGIIKAVPALERLFEAVAEAPRPRSGLKRSWILSTTRSLSIMLLIGNGCSTPRMENVQKLTNHPQFPKAAQTAPEFTKAALETVAELEYQIERRK